MDPMIIQEIKVDRKSTFYHNNILSEATNPRAGVPV